MKLFCVSESVFNLLYFFKYFFFVGWQLVSFCSKAVTNSMEFGKQNPTCFYNTNESYHRSAVFWFVFTGYGKCVENTVSFCDSENHFCEFVEVFGFYYAWDIQKPQLFQCLFIWFRLTIIFVWTKDLPGFEQQIFVVFQFIDFNTELANGPVHSVKPIERFVDLVFDFIQHCPPWHLVLLQIYVYKLPYIDDVLRIRTIH